jgi:hypothetical protein
MSEKMHVPTIEEIQQLRLSGEQTDAQLMVQGGNLETALMMRVALIEEVQITDKE